jgi:hypothetical protein
MCDDMGAFWYHQAPARYRRVYGIA